MVGTVFGPENLKSSDALWGLLFVGKRRYDRKQSGYGGQTKPVFHKKVPVRMFWELHAVFPIIVVNDVPNLNFILYVEIYLLTELKLSKFPWLSHFYQWASSNVSYVRVALTPR